MSVEIDFNSRQEAIATYRGEDPSNVDDSDSTARWGQLQSEGAFPAGGWVLASQTRVDDPETRWFAFRQRDGEVESLESGGTIKTAAVIDGDRMASHGSEDDATAAYDAWAEDEGEETSEDGDDGEEGDGPSWGQWQQVDTAAGWVILRRDHVEEDRSQWIVGSQNDAGEDIYLQPDGTVSSSEHLYESIKAVNQALEAFAKRVNNGDVDEGDLPTGIGPDSPPDQGRGSSSSDLPLIGPAADAVGGSRNLLLLVIVVAVAFYISERQGYTDLVDRWGPAVSGGDA